MEQLNVKETFKSVTGMILQKCTVRQKENSELRNKINQKRVSKRQNCAVQDVFPFGFLLSTQFNYINLNTNRLTGWTMTEYEWT